MQLRTVWEEVLARFREVEVVGEPVRVRSNFVKGYAQLPVRVDPWELRARERTRTRSQASAASAANIVGPAPGSGTTSISDSA